MQSSSRGWLVVLAGVGVNLTLGILYTWSVIAKQLTEQLNWTNTQATLPYTIAIAMFAVWMWPAGRMQDKYGARIVATVGGALCGGGLIIASLSPTPLMVTIGFGLLTGSGIGLAYAASTPVAIKWFPPSKKGLITGIVVTGFGAAPVYASPLAKFLLGTYGVEKSFMILGVSFMVISVLLAQLLNPPPVTEVKPAANAGPAPVTARQYEAKEMLRTSQFYALWVIFMCSALAGLMVIGHAAKIMALKGANWGFVLVAVLAIANAGGRLIAGAISDKLGRTRTMFFMFAPSAAVLGILSFLNSPMLVAAALIIVGFAYGSSVALIPSATADYFGTKNLGTNYGIVFTGWGVGGVFGPMLASYMVDLTGTYSTAYVVAALLSAIAAVLSIMTKAPVEQMQLRKTA
ncbi:L-lactate MFS transporter [Heliophilum fasciatum]|uniref:Sugar phosphate permease n=1 Tax=Heliophilum fasciatum TaxID=35700 RepID=A0A4V2SW25_9FIRM|nr:OFA family MFS transporter [Heliophilum fasciatum]MCW2279345.1 OFA family oxalate/formate antiporter-like MFS transporter [Heliophilum fasciatum]TCP60776.1 sugar phosphate permease [Heliophilum fasciatum]